MYLTKFEFKVLQSLANITWIQNHLREECEDVNQNYLLKKLIGKEYEKEPVYLVNQLDSYNILTLWHLITKIKHKETRHHLIEFFEYCTGFTLNDI